MKSLFINFVRAVQRQSVRNQMKGQKFSLDNLDYFQNISYKENGNKRNVLDIFKKSKNNKLLPVIISFHGGAFVGGEKWYNSEHCTFFAHKDFLVFNVEYNRCPDVSLFGEIQDVFSSIRWIKENIENYGGDPNNIFLMGDSAGSWLIMLFSIINKNQNLQKNYQVKSIDIKINGLVLICPVADIEKAMRYPCHIFWFKPYVYRLNKIRNHPYCLTSIQDVIKYEKLEPCFILTSKGDTYYYSFSNDLKKLFDENEVNYEFHEYQNGERILEHCFNIMHPSYEESVDANNKIISFINTYINI